MGRRQLHVNKRRAPNTGLPRKGSGSRENELIVVVPPVLFAVHAWLHGLTSTSTGRAGASRSHASKAGLLQHVESLLQEIVLEEEAGRVPAIAASVRIPGLVEGLPEHLPAQVHPAGHQDAGQLAELDVRQPVPAERERAAVADDDVPGGPWRVQLGDEPGEVEVLGLVPETAALVEVLRQHDPLVPQEVEDVAEQDPVPVHEELPLGVAEGAGGQGAGEPLAEKGAGDFGEGRAGCGVEDAADVQFDDGGEFGVAVGRSCHGRGSHWWMRRNVWGERDTRIPRKSIGRRRPLLAGIR